MNGGATTVFSASSAGCCAVPRRPGYRSGSARSSSVGKPAARARRYSDASRGASGLLAPAGHQGALLSDPTSSTAYDLYASPGPMSEADQNAPPSARSDASVRALGDHPHIGMSERVKVTLQLNIHQDSVVARAAHLRGHHEPARKPRLSTAIRICPRVTAARGSCPGAATGSARWRP